MTGKILKEVHEWVHLLPITEDFIRNAIDLYKATDKTTPWNCLHINCTPRKYACCYCILDSELIYHTDDALLDIIKKQSVHDILDVYFKRLSNIDLMEALL